VTAAELRLEAMRDALGKLHKKRTGRALDLTLPVEITGGGFVDYVHALVEAALAITARCARCGDDDTRPTCSSCLSEIIDDRTEGHDR
jgi:hypothetical protein